MTYLPQLIFLLPVLPLVGAFWGVVGAVVTLVLAVAGTIATGIFMGSGPSLSQLWAQWAILSLTSGFAIYAGTKRKSAVLDRIEEEKKHLGELEERHLALKNEVLEAQDEERRSLQIYGVAKALAESLSWADMAPRLAAGLQKVFGAYEFLLYARDEEGDWSLLQRRGNWVKELPSPDLDHLSIGYLRPPIVAESVPVLTMPVYSNRGADRHRQGVLFLKSSEQVMALEKLEKIAVEFSEQLGVALNKALLFNQIETHSRVDGLTGVFRRQPFMERLQEELKRASVFHTNFSLIMLDIDHFKAVNDTYGHAAGDAVLNRVGQVLKESFYETDVVGRYGGEEFVVLLPRAEADGVFKKAEALRRRFEQEIVPSGFERLRVTVSLGISHYPAHGLTATALISAADQAMYRAKEGGRNRIEVA